MAFTALPKTCICRTLGSDKSFTTTFAGNFMRAPSHMTQSYLQLVCLVSQPDCDSLISQMGPRSLGRLGLLQVTQQVVAEAGPPSKTPPPPGFLVSMTSNPKFSVQRKPAARSGVSLLGTRQTHFAVVAYYTFYHSQQNANRKCESRNTTQQQRKIRKIKIRKQESFWTLLYPVCPFTKA